jgi:Kip1 ubiquitination-promoting complex protein 1
LLQIQNASSRPERVSIESRQLKICATCFDLALALLRVLEMVVSIAPEIFTDVTRSSSELLLARLCQVCISLETKTNFSKKKKKGCFSAIMIETKIWRVE